MKLLLDSSTVIFSFEHPHSNSRIIFDLILAKKLQGTISEKAVVEIKGMFSAKKNEKFLYVLEKTLRQNFEIIPLNKIIKEIDKWQGKIKEKDLAHLATAKALGIKFIVAFDRDFEPFAEYYTPKQFVEKILKLKGFETEY